MKQLVKPWYGGETWAGGCLPAAQQVVRAPSGPVSATDSANATKWRHADRSFPRTSIAVVWFSHWGKYQNWVTKEIYEADWGHVVIWDPTAFNGAGGFYSSRRWGTGDGEWFRTVEEVERAFTSTFRFWSEDINGVRVCGPETTTNAMVPPVPQVEEDPMPVRHSVKQYNSGQECKPGRWTTLHINKKKDVTVLPPGAKRRVGTAHATIHATGQFEVRFVYDTIDTKANKITKTAGSVIGSYDRKGVHSWPVDLAAKGAASEIRVRVQVRPVGPASVQVSAVRVITDYWEK